MKDKSIEQALIYLKLRELNCKQLEALSFARKKSHSNNAIRYGPPNCRKLIPFNTEQGLKGKVSFTPNIYRKQSEVKRSITAVNSLGRKKQQQQRFTRSKSVLNFNHKTSSSMLEQIATIKEKVMRQRENKVINIEFNGFKLNQTTKDFFKRAENINIDSLIMKANAFQTILTDNKLTLSVDNLQIKGKSLSQHEVKGQNQRKMLLDYQQNILEYKPKCNFRAKVYEGNKKYWKNAEKMLILERQYQWRKKDVYSSFKNNDKQIAS